MQVKPTNFAILGLNTMYGVAPAAASRSVMSAQRSVLDMLQQKVCRTIERVGGCSAAPSGRDALQHLTDDCNRKTFAPKFSAPAFELLADSGNVDPLPLLPEAAPRVVLDADEMFVGAPAGLEKYAGITLCDRKEYVKLVAAQMQTHKVDLATCSRWWHGFCSGQEGVRQAS